MNLKSDKAFEGQIVTWSGSTSGLDQGKLKGSIGGVSIQSLWMFTNESKLTVNTWKCIHIVAGNTNLINLSGKLGNEISLVALLLKCECNI